MKRILKVVTSSLLLTSSLQSYELYIGAQAHIAHLHSKNDAVVNIHRTDQHYNNHHSSQRVHPGWMVGVHAQHQQWVMGLEAEALTKPHAESGLHHRNGFVYTTHLKTKDAYNVGVKCGYFIHPFVMPYVKGIFEKRGFVHAIERNDGTSQDKQDSSFHKSGFGGGIGIEFLLKNNFSTHVEFREINFNSIKYTRRLNDKEYHNYRIKPSHSTLLVGVKYTLGAF